MSERDEKYVCALSGLHADAAPDDDCDGMGDLPVGWTRITFSRRQLNADWVQIQDAKERIVQVYLEQVPPEARDSQRLMFEIQVAAQFAALEAKVPKYVLDVEDTIELSDDDEVTSAINEVRDQLGLEPMPEFDDDLEEESE